MIYSFGFDLFYSTVGVRGSFTVRGSATLLDGLRMLSRLSSSSPSSPSRKFFVVLPPAHPPWRG